MAVPSSIADLSTTAGSNSPSGSEAIGTSLDDYLRAIQSIIKQENARGSDIASASSITIPNAGKYFVVTGVTSITSIADSWNGRCVVLEFSGALTLTNSVSLVLPGGANITTAAGDAAIFCNETTGLWRCVGYSYASGIVSTTGNNTWTGTQTFRDNKFSVTDNSDTTKVLAFEVSGITTGTTRTLTVPDASGTISLAGAVTSSGLTQATGKMLGRSTASTGAIEEITVGSGLSLSGGTLSATGGSGQVFSAYQSSNQSLTSNTWTKVSLQSEEYDPSEVFDSTTNYRFQPTTSGYYLITGAVTFLPFSGLETQTSIYKNGSSFKRGVQNTAAGAVSLTNTISAIVQFNGSTDYVELWANQNGATQNLTTGADSTYFQAVFLRS